LTNVKRLVLDVLKPHNPSTIEISEKISRIKGIDFVNTISEEVDQDTESLRITIEGYKIDFSEVKNIIEDCGGAVHSIDEVTVGKRPNRYSKKRQQKKSEK
jgi:hypothetical protein